MSNRAARFFFAAWALTALLLGKSALPLLAAAAAGLRAQDLVEVCTVYGLRTVAAAPSQRDASSPSLAKNPGMPGSAGSEAEACALGWLPPAGPLPVDSPSGRPQADAPALRLTRACGTTAPADAVRAWRALLKQGPPRA